MTEFFKVLWKHIKKWAIDVNFCHSTDSNGEAKVVTGSIDRAINKFIGFYRMLFWPIPTMEEPCWCCASVRGIVYGYIIGCLMYKVWFIPLFFLAFWVVLSGVFILKRVIKEMRNGMQS